MADGSRPVKLAIPMVSFCDLPLSDLDPFFNQYHKGDGVAIGISRKWGHLLGATPVHYSSKESVPFRQLIGQVKELVNDIDKIKPKSAAEAMLMQLAISKNYDNQLLPKLYSTYRFYDEREVRILPNGLPLSDMFRSFEWYQEQKEMLQAPVFLDNNSKSLSFFHSDLKYIIVADDEQHSRLTEIKTEVIEPSILEISNITFMTYAQYQEDVLGINHHKRITKKK